MTGVQTCALPIFLVYGKNKEEIKFKESAWEKFKKRHKIDELDHAFCTFPDYLRAELADSTRHFYILSPFLKRSNCIKVSVSIIEKFVGNKYLLTSFE